MLAKRDGHREKAAEMWQELARDPKDGVEACEQLAIHYERHAKDFEQALEFAQLALMKLERQGWSSRDPIWHGRRSRRQEKLMCRIKRLRHRIMKSNPAAKVPLLVKAAAARACSPRPDNDFRSL